MLEFKSQVEGALVPHNVDGPDVQMHQIGEEFFITLSETLVENIDWQRGDTIVWTVNEDTGEVSVTNHTATLRRKLSRDGWIEP